jgi:hypothetical protein
MLLPEDYDRWLDPGVRRRSRRANPPQSRTWAMASTPAPCDAPRRSAQGS